MLYSTYFVDFTRDKKVHGNIILAGVNFFTLNTKILLGEVIDIVNQLDDETTNLVKLFLKFTFFRLKGEIYEHAKGSSNGFSSFLDTSILMHGELRAEGFGILANLRQDGGKDMLMTPMSIGHFLQTI